jgi:hypothetical protein
MLGRPCSELTGPGFLQFVHDGDRAEFEQALASGGSATLEFRLQNAAGAWRHVEAHLTDLRSDRHVHGVVLNARDITDRVELQQELTRQAQRDNFGTQLTEALEMADEEVATYEVIERAMSEISPTARMELLLSDSSRTSLDQAAVHAAGAPAAPCSRRSRASPSAAAIPSCSSRARR